ncbi:DUF2169 domain-containing protein [Massilia sp. CCM 8734]|uniref:DUF2169 family type VI secretion system accessory protein n=1 Tax=Massilia sp. CCM 8734 TaxID=2609283 RepID=UPI0014231D08|nr:DUF2169 domain-containing protein [Massilia sp. CCM 8734]NIA00558.1 DUF2169 domain-containing protein [Massilia sp. CCM 8734]
MKIINHTGVAAGYTAATDTNGRQHLLVVIKATYRLPLGGEAAQLLDTQLAPTQADTATGKPGMSAPEYDCDYVLTKPRCEVLLLGSAYAPQGKPAQRVDVGFRVGAVSKAFHVYGKRAWRANLLGVAAGPAEPFIRQPISYDIAFGGAENNPAKGDKRAVYLANPIGRGFQKNMKRSLVDGVPMPQTQAVGVPVKHPRKAYRPMGFGPLGRNWPGRLQYAGTYDAAWRKNVFPFLPSDFDERYFQSAPPDQQLDALLGGETVTLLNLTHPAITPAGRLDFTLPSLALTITVHPNGAPPETLPARADTVLLEPDLQRFSIIWRVARPLRRSIDEIRQVEVGMPTRADRDFDPTECCRAPAAQVRL